MARTAPVRVVAALVFLFPVVVATTGGAASYIYVALLAAGLVWGRGWRELEDREKQLLLGFAGAFVVMTLATFRADDAAQGLERLTRFARIASIAPIYLMFRRFDFSLHRYLGAGAWVATLVMAGQAWYQVSLADQDRATGAYHHLVFGNLAVLWGCLAVLVCLTLARGRLGVTAAAVAAGAATYASILSQARGSWLFAPVFLLAVGWIYLRPRARPGPPRWALGVVLLSAAAVGVWQAERVADRTREAVAELALFSEDPGAEASLAIRLNLWRNTLLLVRGAPLLGAGLGNFQRRMIEMVEDGRSWSPWVREYAHAHSIYFDALATAGLLGLAATVGAYLLLPLWVFGGMLGRFETSDGRFCAAAGAVTVLAFATFGLSEGLWTRNPFVNTYVICIAVMLAGLPWARLWGTRSRSGEPTL